MDAERWRRLQRLFDEAIELPAAERQDFVARSCADDAGLAERLRAMLGAAPEAVDDAVSDGMQQVLEPTLPASGVRIGPYRIERELGRGGMGAVFLATRDDDFHKQVAIKLIVGRADRGALERFRAERQILATLEHPNVARLLDGGTTEDGLPFVVMEYVDGVPIDRFCEERALDLDARVDLFRELCAAVQAAHRNLVVHRDIKPSNVLVDADGTPRLLDFGIAKPLVADARPLTATSTRVMTPDYASPEQIRGEPVTTATDIYSLGVLLFELLTGERPYRLSSGNLGELERAITDQEPGRPSAATAAPDVDGDLDAIVLRALRKEPLARYDSVAALSEDLRRYRVGLPVEARRGDLRYRARKFARRHRVGVAAGLLVLAVVATGVASTTLGLVRARRAEALAQREATTATAVSELLMDVMFGADPLTLQGESYTPRELVDRAAERIGPETLDDPLVLARMQHNLGIIYANLNEMERATELLRAAIATRDGAGAFDVRRQAGSLNSLGWMLGIRGLHAEAEAALLRSIELFESLDAPDLREQARATANLAQMHAERNDLAGAARLYRRALELRRSLDPAHPDVGFSLMLLAGTLSAQVDHEVALERLAEARETLEAALGADHVGIAEVDLRRAQALSGLARHEEALVAGDSALALTARVFGTGHPLYADVEVARADALIALGREGRAIDSLQTAASIYRASFGAEDARAVEVAARLSTLRENVEMQDLTP